MLAGSRLERRLGKLFHGNSEAVGRVNRRGALTRLGAQQPVSEKLLPHLRLMLRYVHSKQYELPD